MTEGDVRSEHVAETKAAAESGGVDMTGFLPRLELRQSQTLIMTPQLQQSIKVLQLSNLELTDFIDVEIQQNPLLEWRERGIRESAPGDDVVGGESAPPMTVPEMLTGEFTPDAAGHWQPEWGEDGDRHVDFGGEPQPWHSRNGGFYAEGRPGLDQTATRLRTLREYLLEQIGADLSDQSDRVIALHLLDLLDEDGYLRAGLDEVTRLLGCGKGLEPATHSLGFESGVAADVSSTSCRQSPGFGHHRRQHGGQRDQMRQATTQKCILISRSGATNRGLRWC